MNDKIMEAGFDHPCRQTCSGWKQGFERGQMEANKKLRIAVKAMEKYLTDPAADKSVLLIACSQIREEEKK